MTETKKYLPAIGLALCVLVLAWSYIDLNKRYAALENANQSLENDLLELNETNESLIEKLEAETFQIQEREERIAELEEKLNTPPKHEEVDNIPDSDTDRISELFTRHYPHN